MDFLQAVPPGVVSGVIASILIGIYSWRYRIWTKKQDRKRRLGHLIEYFRSVNRVNIYLGTFDRHNLREPGEGPDNVLFGPVNDAKAAEQLSKALREAQRGLRVDLVPAPAAFHPDGQPFISLGGPFYNDVTKQLIERHLGSDYQYPWVHIGGKEVRISRDAANNIREDYGFLLAGKTTNDTPFIAIWGIYSFGTMAAIQALLSDLDDAYRTRLAQKDKLPLSVWHAMVDRHQLGAVVRSGDYLELPFRDDAPMAHRPGGPCRGCLTGLRAFGRGSRRGE